MRSPTGGRHSEHLPVVGFWVNSSVWPAGMNILLTDSDRKFQRDGLEGTQNYKRLSPFLVLGGLQGLRTCEMIRERTKDPVIEWRDFLWKKAHCGAR
jgi:hypothetical protein